MTFTAEHVRQQTKLTLAPRVISVRNVHGTTIVTLAVHARRRLMMEYLTLSILSSILNIAILSTSAFLSNKYNTYKEVLNNMHLDYMLKNGIDVPEQHEQLPSFYWLPKLHKKTYNSRCTAASNKCTTKQLSSLLTSCFKTIFTHYKQYCDGICNYSGIFGGDLLITVMKYWTGYIKLIKPQELDNLIVVILLHYIRISHMMP